MALTLHRDTQLLFQPLPAGTTNTLITWPSVFALRTAELARLLLPLPWENRAWDGGKCTVSLWIINRQKPRPKTAVLCWSLESATHLGMFQQGYAQKLIKKKRCRDILTSTRGENQRRPTQTHQVRKYRFVKSSRNVSRPLWLESQGYRAATLHTPAAENLRERFVWGNGILSTAVKLKNHSKC